MKKLSESSLERNCGRDGAAAPGKIADTGGSGTARVAHFEARDADGKTTDREACANRTPRERSRS